MRREWAAFALGLLGCVGQRATLLEEDCPAGLASCDGICIDATTDRNNCGACGQACPEGELCSLATCGTECFGGTLQCGDRCVDTAIDPLNCGGCDAACGAGESCLDSKCSGCSDGTKSGSESDIDCGGTCAKCVVGKDCVLAADCESNLCTSGQCAQCQLLDDCGNAQNCVDGACVAALASCADQKAMHGSPDGEYWIATMSMTERVYCDMQLGVVLCSQVESAHDGQTREGSALAYTMTSLLDGAAGICETWAIRSVADGYPLDGLALVAGKMLTTCEALGFLSEVSEDGCAYGSSYTNCGYPVSAYYRYGNACAGCMLNDGPHPSYVLQGPMGTASVATTMDGMARLRCRVRP